MYQREDAKSLSPKPRAVMISKITKITDPFTRDTFQGELSSNYVETVGSNTTVSPSRVTEK
jgi:hypothetical protein